MNEVAGKAPDTSLVKTGWIILIVGWVIMLLPIPMTGWLGGVIAGIGGCVIAIVNLVRGVVGIGIAQLLCALVVTPIVYWIGLAIFGAALVGAASTAG